MSKMTIIPAREAKNRFGEMLDAVQRQPVTITKNGRPVAILTAVVDRKRFEEVEDMIWAERAVRAEKNGTLGVAKSKKVLAQWMREV